MGVVVALGILGWGPKVIPLPLPRPSGKDGPCAKETEGDGEGDGDRRLANLLGGGETGEVSVVDGGVWYDGVCVCEEEGDGGIVAGDLG